MNDIIKEVISFFAFFHSSKKKKSRTGIQYKNLAIVCKSFPSRLQTSFILSAVPSPRHKLPSLCCPGDRHLLSALCLQHTHQEMNQVIVEAPATPHIPLSQKDGETPLSEGEVRIYPQRQPPGHSRQQGAGAPHPRTPWGHRRPVRAPRLGCDLAGALANHIWNVFQLQEQ